ncbi:SWIRM domain-containing protein FUN19 [Daldinia childiae]|uniref:SWIRM domain-containing protein FUN19 n=1 Tax=Daldinia childiae TaxID=326645 RepID=UPI0014464DB2|nr:SWIRM domain-containing protein FUN19 [Daldinia childiae]KAF3055214.1 SWIRM domain-containing protein FUN19 [Daldinia childiae]
MDKNAKAPIASSTESGFKNPLDISNLMSPPEPPRLDSFSHGRESKSIGPTISDVRRLHPISPISPPISPATKTDDHSVNPASSTSITVQDPILYPPQDVTRSPQQQPLFSQDDSIDVRRIVDEHVNVRPAGLFGNTSPPKREDYELILYFNSQVLNIYQRDPKAWLKRERELLLADRRAGARNNQFKLQPKPILPAKLPQIRKETQRAKTAKPAKVVKATQSNTAAPRPIRSYPTTNPGQSANRPPSATPDPSPRRAVAPNREDKDFASLPNYCPPLNSLPERSNSLKVDWKGTPIDLSNDPHRYLLHPDEITLAANLRLDCATYLTSKRRMFIRRRECLKMGKEFRKTDAQQACKIDVNKASKLWTAFDKVGWLEKTWMADFM